ncbi:hypothetical protein ES319_A12G073000v1 [Gossypium barbadense]|uniref:Uncharacterized protein n=1 Tax=Gossypium barbadense TaxID=3634 RepID=A0A5J5T7U5_GOSBA|nr:hypothetical protein ES319_A12G073000v1 [Gossypium barbadense]
MKAEVELKKQREREREAARIAKRSCSNCITKGISDNKIYHYHLNLGGSVSTRRLTRLPSIPKNDAKFSSLHSYRIHIQ